MDLVILVYRLTEKFPKHEQYALTSQMRRAAVSIPSNIAEGRRRGTENEFRHFSRIALGSAAELETQIEIAFRLEYDNAESFKGSMDLLDEVLRMLNKISF